MSELTLCCFCSLNQIKAQAHRNKLIVTLKPRNLEGSDLCPNGQDVHVHQPGEKPSKKNWKAWMCDISDHCVC